MVAIVTVIQNGETWNRMDKYDINFSDDIIKSDIKRIINQIYKLLPMREENSDWEKPLQTIIEELVGMKRLFLGWQEETFLILLCKLQGMFELTQSIDFSIYRRTIFECLSLLGDIKKNV